jgi:enoyl-CoA hydratase/carnithine racemase
VLLQRDGTITSVRSNLAIKFVARIYGFTRMHALARTAAHARPRLACPRVPLLCTSKLAASRLLATEATAQAAAAASAAATSPLRFVITDGIALVTMTAPKNRNALSRGMMSALAAAFSDACAGGARAVVLAAEGPAFCAGHDMRELQALQQSGFEADATALFEQCGELMQQIVRLPLPVIAAVHAVATAAGCQLAASCDIVIAERRATFATPGVNIGLFCTTPAVALSRAVGHKKAAEMLFTGLPQSAEDMRAAGLVNSVVDGDPQDAALAMAHIIASKPAPIIALGKRAFQLQLGLPLAQAYEAATPVMCGNLVREPDCAEGVGAFLAKRKPQWAGR